MAQAEWKPGPCFGRYGTCPFPVGRRQACPCTVMHQFHEMECLQDDVRPKCRALAKERAVFMRDLQGFTADVFWQRWGRCMSVAYESGVAATVSRAERASCLELMRNRMALLTYAREVASGAYNK